MAGCEQAQRAKQAQQALLGDIHPPWTHDALIVAYLTVSRTMSAGQSSQRAS
jgi:hypothetical protein